LQEEFGGEESPKDTKTPLFNLPKMVSAGPSDRLAPIRVLVAGLSAGTAPPELHGLESS